MLPPSMQGPARSRNETVDTSRRFSELYFGYASNLSPLAMKGRCPDSIFCGLAKLHDWRWQINSTQYGNIVPSPGDHVIGALFFLSPRDEAGLDESEGVPWMYEKQTHDVERIDAQGKGMGQSIPAMTYVDVQRPEEGTIINDYVVWIHKAIRDAKPYGLTDEYVAKYLLPYIPVNNPGDDDDKRDLEPVRSALKLVLQARMVSTSDIGHLCLTRFRAPQRNDDQEEITASPRDHAPSPNMSFSLSSLLNPADEPAAKEPSTEQRRESQASAQALVASPEQQHVSLPKYTPPPPRQVPPEQVTALSAFAASSAPPPTEWNGYTAHDAQRELPPLPTMSSGDRKMSSPTLDQYHVASRSPEQHRASLSSAQSAAFALPPLKHVISPPEAAAETSLPVTHETVTPSVKKEVTTPQPSSPIDARRSSLQPTDMESKAVASLKTEHSARYQSPLRESSTPMPSTEISAPDSVVPKKRPAPKKKGTAAAKKAPPAKRRKVEVSRSDTPSSRVSKSNFVTGSSKGTPANSSPAPSARSRSAGVDDDDDDEEEGSPVGDDMYCICRRPDTGTFMIGCDGTCDDWFHGKCVGIEERDKNLIDKYMCPNCTSGGVGKTTWKRMCRRSGCRQAARVGKNKSGGSGSKYCSDDCGVLFFREMTANARGREQTAKSRASRRGKVDDAETVIDPGARGGLLAPGEVRALLDTSKTLDDFKKLGEGVLSPPATPGDKGDDGGTDASSGTTLNEQETSELAGITAKKEAARDRHSLLKDRLKFVSLVKQAASRAMAEKELKATKDYCGFDPRLEWSEEQFAVWRQSAAGKRAYEMDLLDVEPTEADEEAMSVLERAEIEADTVFGGVEPCERKKCARHAEWAKLATDDVRFEMTDNGDKMRVLERGEHAVRERAALRARGGVQDAAEDDDEATRMDVDIPASNAMTESKSTGPATLALDEAARDTAMTNGIDHPEATSLPLTIPKAEPVTTTNGIADIPPEHTPQIYPDITEHVAVEVILPAETTIQKQAIDVAIST
nr:hypothetical protein B0A51_18429 [Rachicladosporium sp. CCFEE 5018]